jgi:hypothetical protein
LPGAPDTCHGVSPPVSRRPRAPRHVSAVAGASASASPRDVPRLRLSGWLPSPSLFSGAGGPFHGRGAVGKARAWRRERKQQVQQRQQCARLRSICPRWEPGSRRAVAARPRHSAGPRPAAPGEHEQEGEKKKNRVDIRNIMGHKNKSKRDAGERVSHELRRAKRRGRGGARGTLSHATQTLTLELEVTSWVLTKKTYFRKAHDR